MAEIKEEIKLKFSEKGIEFTASLALLIGFLVGAVVVLLIDRFA